MRKHPWRRGAGLIALVPAAAALAQSGGTITDGNASFTIGDASTVPTSTGPNASFSVDGGTTDHVFQNWWWYRLSTDTRENAFNSGAGVGETSSFVGNTGMMQQFYPSFRADLTWEVESTGASTGFFTSRVTITNTSTSTISINLFNYMDVDMNGTAGGDSASLIAPNLIEISDTVVSQYSGFDATNYQVTTFATLRGALTDSDEDNFNNTGLPFGPGDFTGGFQWANIPVDPGFARSVTITYAIPAPASLAVLGLGVLATSRRRRG